MTDLFPNDDQEIPDPDNLDRLASMFVDGSYVDFEDDLGEFTRKVFRGGKTQDFSKLGYLPAQAYTQHDDIIAHIVEVEKYLADLETI